MKKTAICICLPFVFYACGNKGTTNTTTSGQDTVITNQETTGGKSETADAIAIFDINTIPVTDKDLGTFPYLNAPETYQYGYDGFKQEDIKDFDKEYFAVNGKLIPVEGKSYKNRLEKDSSDGKRFNSMIVDRSYETAIKALGGVLVNNVPVPDSEIKRIGNKELIEKKYGASLDFNRLDEIKTYIIRTKNKEIWIQYTLMNEESGWIAILEKSNLETLKVNTINADAMKKDLEKSGKAILNINFDTDKATLKPDGQKIVDEIVLLLKQNPDLKLSIEGHTDNTGNAAKNKQLSQERANTVMQYLVITGASKNNLKAAGFGAEKPLAANSTEENKARNRRVELVKF